MKRYNICVRSYPSNNYELSEYDNYYLKSDSWEEAKKEAEVIIKHWNEVNKKGLIYNIEHITPHN